MWEFGFLLCSYCSLYHPANSTICISKVTTIQLFHLSLRVCCSGLSDDMFRCYLPFLLQETLEPNLKSFFGVDGLTCLLPIHFGLLILPR